MKNKFFYLAAGILLVCGLLFFLGIILPGLGRMFAPPPAPTPDLLATLAALTPVAAQSSVPSTPTAISTDGQPTGKIVFTCQVFQFQSSDQICIMNADGSGYRRLTTEDGIRHYYPSLAPDGKSVLYSAFREANVYEIYAMTLDGRAKRLTDRFGVLDAPEISPDGRSIVFMRWTVASDKHTIWVMDRDGSRPRQVFSGVGWDPTWSPDGKQILFASDRDGSNQLYIVNLDGTALRKVSNLPALRGRSDWSPQNTIATYSGDPWKREIYLMDADGSNQRQISPSGGNSQGPAFSPDGQWIAFTAYFDHFNDIHGCEIYIMRVDGADLRRLTDDDYCDYQPRWGP